MRTDRTPPIARRFLFLILPVFLLTGAPEVSADPNPRGATSRFRIRDHGFNFVNAFTSRMILKIPGVGRVDLARNSYGLCGGMIYAAHDSYWYESTSGRRTTTPDRSGGRRDVPKQGSKLREYLWNRQIDSLKKDDWWAVRKMLVWMGKPLDDRRRKKGLKTLTWKEFVEASRRMDKGWAVPLLLVNTRLQGNLADAFTRNHQVLAIGYGRQVGPDGRRQWVVRTYDPNCPDRESRLYLTARANSCGSVRFRGFFITKYRGQTPYWGHREPRPPFRPGAPEPSLRDPFGTGGKGLGKPEALPEDPRQTQ